MKFWFIYTIFNLFEVKSFPHMDTEIANKVGNDVRLYVIEAYLSKSSKKGHCAN